MIKTLEWTDAGVRFIDQTKLPTEETYVTCKNYEEVADAIRTMIVRGAPAIGVAAAMGVASAYAIRKTEQRDGIRAATSTQICDVLAATRPTAVNLFWAIRRMRDKFDQLRDAAGRANQAELVAEAQRMLVEDIAANEAMGQHGAVLLPHGGVLTHCNAGALATAGYGTALGVIRAAVESGKKLQVFADETRPFLQGSRLTAWELMKDGIPTTLIADNMAGAMMRAGQDRCRNRRRRPHRRQRRCGQQDRHLHRGGAGEGARHSVLRGRADFDRGSRHSGRQQDSHRAARCERGDAHLAGKQIAPDGVR